MANEVILTSEGKKKLEDKLDNLINVKRAEVADRIKIAREFGDISENAEYDAAKDEQAMIEQEIKETQDKLANAKIINEADIEDGVVVLGSYVKIHDIDFGDKIEYQIVGTAEEDIAENKISNESPLARAVIGQKKGATVTFRAPSGDVKVKILDIRRG